MNTISPEAYRIPAFMRKNELKRRDKKKLIITAYDREQVALKKRTYKKHSAIPITVGNYTPPNYPKQHLTPTSRAKTSDDTPSISYIGKMTHYYDKINVGVIKLEGNLKQGDYIIIGKNIQKIHSLQINRKNVHSAKCGDDIGLKLENRAVISDKVYVITFS